MRKPREFSGRWSPRLTRRVADKEGAAVGTFGEARDYILAQPERRQDPPHWQYAAKLLLEEAEAEAVTCKIERALFMEARLHLGD
jgi:hypothetical protein